MLGQAITASGSGLACETLAASMFDLKRASSSLPCIAEIKLPSFYVAQHLSLLAIVPTVSLFLAWYVIQKSPKPLPVSSEDSRRRVIVSSLLLVALLSMTADIVAKWRQDRLFPAPFGGIHHRADLRYLADIHTRLSHSIQNFYEWQAKHPDGNVETVRQRLEVALNLRTNAVDWTRQFIARSSNPSESEEAIESILFEMTPHRSNQAGALRFVHRDQSQLDQESTQLNSQIAKLELVAKEAKAQLDAVPKDDANQDQRTAAMNKRIEAEEQLTKLRDRRKQVDARQKYLQSFYGPMLQSANPENASLPRGHLFEHPWLKLPVTTAHGTWFGWISLIATSLLLLHLLFAVGLVLTLSRSNDLTIRQRDMQFAKRFILGLAIGSTLLTFLPFLPIP